MEKLIIPMENTGNMTINEAVKRACQEPTLLDALSWICIWESERIVKQAKKNLRDVDGKGWDTCFKICLGRVMRCWPDETTGEKHKDH